MFLTGYTKQLNAQATAQPGSVSINITITDVGDSRLDSAVFLKQGSLRAVPTGAPTLVYQCVVGATTQCSVTCGQGTQTTAYTCQGVDGSGRAVNVPLGNCPGCQQSQVSNSCNLPPCEQLSCVAGTSTCSVTCGTGVTTTTRQCASTTRGIVPNSTPGCPGGCASQSTGPCTQPECIKMCPCVSYTTDCKSTPCATNSQTCGGPANPAPSTTQCTCVKVTSGSSTKLPVDCCFCAQAPTQYVQAPAQYVPVYVSAPPVQQTIQYQYVPVSAPPVQQTIQYQYVPVSAAPQYILPQYIQTQPIFTPVQQPFTTQTSYVRGAANTNICPPGTGSTPITSEAGCRAAAQFLGLSFVRSDDFPIDAQGCFYDTSASSGGAYQAGVYFNTALSSAAHPDDSPICQTTTQVQVQSTQTNGQLQFDAATGQWQTFNAATGQWQAAAATAGRRLLQSGVCTAAQMSAFFAAADAASYIVSLYSTSNSGTYAPACGGCLATSTNPCYTRTSQSLCQAACGGATPQVQFVPQPIQTPVQTPIQYIAQPPTNYVNTAPIVYVPSPQTQIVPVYYTNPPVQPVYTPPVYSGGCSTTSNPCPVLPPCIREYCSASSPGPCSKSCYVQGDSPQGVQYTSQTCLRVTTTNGVASAPQAANDCAIACPSTSSACSVPQCVAYNCVCGTPSACPNYSCGTAGTATTQCQCVQSPGNQVVAASLCSAWGGCGQQVSQCPPLPPCVGYQCSAGPWSGCPTGCNQPGQSQQGAVSTRQITCYATYQGQPGLANSQQAVPISYCSANPRDAASGCPTDTQTCPQLPTCVTYVCTCRNTGSCSLATCGATSSIGRTCQCVTQGTGQSVATSNCIGGCIAEQNTGVTQCPPLPPCTQYKCETGPWSGCPTACAQQGQAYNAVSTRTVGCMRYDTVNGQNTGAGYPVPDSNCSADTQPIGRGTAIAFTCPGATTQACTVQICKTYACSCTTSGACSSATCGASGSRLQTCQCTETGSGLSVPASMCANTYTASNNGQCQSTSLPCPALPCCYQYACSLGVWSSCSTTCGQGSMTRPATCQRSCPAGNEAVQSVDPSLCSQASGRGVDTCQSSTQPCQICAQEQGGVVNVPVDVYTQQQPVYTQQQPVYTVPQPVYTQQQPVYTQSYPAVNTGFTRLANGDCVWNSDPTGQRYPTTFCTGGRRSAHHAAAAEHTAQGSHSALAIGLGVSGGLVVLVALVASGVKMTRLVIKKQVELELKQLAAAASS
jgi:hypothetical protein